MSEEIKILVIGSNGQIGSVLTKALSNKYGSNNVIGSDLKTQKHPTNFIFEQCSVLDKEKLETIIHTYKITDVYLLAACLSAKGEKNIERAWNLNVTGLMHILNFAKEKKIKKVFWPSSIAVFGPTTPKYNVGQHALAEPITIYGVSKLAGENLCNYFNTRFNVD